MKIKSNKVGVCPFCDNETLTYGSLEMFGDMVMFPWDCLHCNNKGQEVYDLKFVSHDVINEKGYYVPIDDDMIKDSKELGLKEILFELFDSYEEYEIIRDSLRNLTSNKYISLEDYDIILDNYNEWLKEYNLVKENEENEN